MARNTPPEPNILGAAPEKSEFLLYNQVGLGGKYTNNTPQSFSWQYFPIAYLIAA